MADLGEGHGPPLFWVNKKESQDLPINMHILRNVFCTLLKWRQGYFVENKIRASLVGDHFIYSCELHV